MKGPEDLKHFPGAHPEDVEAMDSAGTAPDPAEMEFEQQLARALQQVAAPEGFATRLMERAAKGDSARAIHVPGRSPGRGPRILQMPRRQWLGWASGAIAAMLVTGIFVGQRVHEEHERRVQANREFDAAMRIQDQALDRVRQQLAQQGISLGSE